MLLPSQCTYMYKQSRKNKFVLTIANMAAISEECPNGSICQATLGLASAPKLSSTNLTPKTEKSFVHTHNCVQTPIVRYLNATVNFY